MSIEKTPRGARKEISDMSPEEAVTANTDALRRVTDGESKPKKRSKKSIDRTSLSMGGTKHYAHQLESLGWEEEKPAVPSVPEVAPEVVPESIPTETEPAPLTPSRQEELEQVMRGLYEQYHAPELSEGTKLELKNEMRKAVMELDAIQSAANDNVRVDEVKERLAEHAPPPPVQVVPAPPPVRTIRPSSSLQGKSIKQPMSLKKKLTAMFAGIVGLGSADQAAAEAFPSHLPKFDTGRTASDGLLHRSPEIKRDGPSQGFELHLPSPISVTIEKEDGTGAEKLFKKLQEKLAATPEAERTVLMNDLIARDPAQFVRDFKFLDAEGRSAYLHKNDSLTVNERGELVVRVSGKDQILLKTIPLGVTDTTFVVGDQKAFVGKMDKGVGAHRVEAPALRAKAGATFRIPAQPEPSKALNQAEEEKGRAANEALASRNPEHLARAEQYERAYSNVAAVGVIEDPQKPPTAVEPEIPAMRATVNDTEREERRVRMRGIMNLDAVSEQEVPRNLNEQ